MQVAGCLPLTAHLLEAGTAHARGGELVAVVLRARTFNTTNSDVWQRGRHRGVARDRENQGQKHDATSSRHAAWDPHRG